MPSRLRRCDPFFAVFCGWGEWGDLAGAQVDGSFWILASASGFCLLLRTYHFSSRTQMQAGDNWLVKYNLIAAFDKNPFI
jgi:hypothetical protein